jgi:hypothetical protein
MSLDFDPDVFLEGIRRDGAAAGGHTKVAKDTNFSMVRTLAGGTPVDTVSGSSVSVSTKAAKDTKAVSLSPDGNTKAANHTKVSIFIPPSEPHAAGVPSAKVLTILKFEIRPLLRAALVRELWQAEDGRSFLIDVSVRAETPLLEQAPVGIAPARWRAAVAYLSECLTGRIISRAYENQPIITIGSSIWVSLGRDGSK